MATVEPVDAKKIDEARKTLDDHEKLEKLRCANEIRIEQYKSLREEIRQRVVGHAPLEISAVVGIAAYYAWLLTQCVPDLLSASLFGLNWSAIWLLPVWVPLVGIWRAHAVSGGILRVAAYIRMIEGQFDNDGLQIGPNKGWESFIEEKRSRSLWLRIVSRSSEIWALLLVLTLIIGLFVGPRLGRGICVP